MDTGSRLSDISAALTRLLGKIQSHPITTAQACELELELHARRLHDALRDDPSGGVELIPILTSLRKTVAELKRCIADIRMLNGGLLARHKSQASGYDGAGRPAGPSQIMGAKP